MSTALVPTQQEQALVPQTQRGILTREALSAATEQRQLLSEYVKQNMVAKVDFGRIPGTDKDTLLKPGAEKLVELFRCTPRFRLMERIEDFDKPLFAYTFRVRLYQRDAMAVLAEGYGSANSREGRYRWRNANPKCPVCGKEALFRSKQENKPGFYCWGKKGGCGAQFGPTDPGAKAAFENTGRVENDDIATQANTILKVAKKRALVDGAIALARVSDLFTQDVDDDHGQQEEREDREETQPKAAPASQKRASKTEPLWKQVVIIATDYGFERGEGNKLLWDFCEKVLEGKKAKEWTEEDVRKLNVAISAAVPRAPDEVLSAKEDNDIPF